jgi:hypothetical protein
VQQVVAHTTLMEKVSTKLPLDGDGAVNMEPRLERVKYFETVLEQRSNGDRRKTSNQNDAGQEFISKRRQNPVIICHAWA